MDESVDTHKAAVLREVSHDLGNQFHRYYYLSSQLRDRLGADAETAETEASTLVDGLEGAVSEIEQLVRETLGWLSPIELRQIALDAGDLITSLVGRSPDRWVEAEIVDDVRNARVRVDPVRIGELLDRALAWGGLGLAPGHSLRVRCLASGGLVRLGFELADALPRVEREGISMAVATQLAQSHGGRVALQDAEPGQAPILWLELPIIEQGEVQ
ncbi:MAG: hypothetical protein ACI8TX_001359 [Hyphomicrobiaceae bacterium]|jgi:hypothetical protein